MSDACLDSLVYNPDTRTCQGECNSGEVMQGGVCVVCPDNTIPDLTRGECRKISKLVVIRSYSLEIGDH